MGFLPYLSDNFPKIGLNKNCTNEYTATTTPIAVSSTNNSILANVGRMGISIPNPSKSINTVKNIKLSADFFLNKLFLNNNC